MSQCRPECPDQLQHGDTSSRTLHPQREQRRCGVLVEREAALCEPQSLEAWAAGADKCDAGCAERKALMRRGYTQLFKAAAERAANVAEAVLAQPRPRERERANTMHSTAQRLASPIVGGANLPQLFEPPAVEEAEQRNWRG